jgi:diguanylate cyclase
MCSPQSKNKSAPITTLQREFEGALHNLDPLTGIPSRAAMLTKLREQHELVKRKVNACVVAMIDLDHFKDVNDKYGHLVGDKVLITVAQYIASHLRPYDMIFRYGGEEFLICLPDTDVQTGSGIMNRLRDDLGSLSQEQNGGGIFHVAVSVGLTALDPNEPIELSIDRADRALYVAKASGRNRSIVWDASIDVSLAGSRRSA